MPGYDRRNVVAGDHRHRSVNQISHQSRQSIDLIIRIAIIDNSVLSLDKAFFLQALAERDDKVLERRGRCAAEKADHGHRALLRARRNRPRRPTPEQRDELAPFQLIEEHSLPYLAHIVIVFGLDLLLLLRCRLLFFRQPLPDLRHL